MNLNREQVKYFLPHPIRRRLKILPLIVGLGIMLLFPFSGGAVEDPLPSWNDGPSRRAITAFVQAVTDRRSPDYVKPEKRIAVFDNDGTMWTEKPLYFQLLYVFARIHEQAPKHPQWRRQLPFKAVLENDRKALRQCGLAGIKKLLAAARAGSDAETFAASVRNWAARTRHPHFKKPCTELVFQPMLELLAYLEKHGFTCFIVSGGGVDFMRVLLPGLYHLPPWRIVGSFTAARYAAGRVERLPELAFFDNGPMKPVAIARHIGIRPILACGNADGDLEMLQYTAAGPGRSLEIYIHHTDEKREYAYDRKSRVGTLDRGLDYARQAGWTVVDMKKEWQTIFRP